MSPSGISPYFFFEMPANKWVDVFSEVGRTEGQPGLERIFPAWMEHKHWFENNFQCPSKKVVVRDTDEPGWQVRSNKEKGVLTAQQLGLAVRVVSSQGCDCQHSERMWWGAQFLASIGRARVSWRR